MNTYENTPIIVLGVNHSGTRVVVDILSHLGSDGGDNSNKWRESETFIRAHYLLLGCSSADDWNHKIFDLRFYKYGLPIYDEKVVCDFLRDQIPMHFPNFKSAPWHWKCPTSALFLDFWLKQYPKGFYIHIVRNRYDVAYSLLRRKQFRSIRKALEFYDLVEDRLASLNSRSLNYLRLDFHKLESEIYKLVRFLPFLSGDLNEAVHLIKRKKICLSWNSTLSLKTNIWNNYNIVGLFLARMLGI